MRSRGNSAPTFYETITAAVADFATYGYDSEDRLSHWLDEIRHAAERDLISDEELTRQLRATLGAIYVRLVERDGLLREHAPVGRFRFERLKPHLRDELGRRVLAGAQLVKLNRAAAIDTALRRFTGWASSVPAGGDEDAQRNVIKSDIRKALAGQSFEARRVSTDQAAKFVAALNEIVATDGGALAVRWNHIRPRPSYQSRPDHLARDGKVYALRGNWALQRGLMKAGPDGYYDETPGFAVEPYCSCTGTYLYALARLPRDMLTEAGENELARVRAAA